MNTISNHGSKIKKDGQVMDRDGVTNRKVRMITLASGPPQQNIACQTYLYPCQNKPQTTCGATLSVHNFMYPWSHTNTKKTMNTIKHYSCSMSK